LRLPAPDRAKSRSVSWDLWARLRPTSQVRGAGRRSVLVKSQRPPRH
jgi:hypothetical protein